MKQATISNSCFWQEPCRHTYQYSCEQYYEDLGVVGTEHLDAPKEASGGIRAPSTAGCSCFPMHKFPTKL